MPTFALECVPLTPARILRMVWLADAETVHNAIFDRRSMKDQN